MTESHKFSLQESAAKKVTPIVQPVPRANSVNWEIVERHSFALTDRQYRPCTGFLRLITPVKLTEANKLYSVIGRLDLTYTDDFTEKGSCMPNEVFLLSCASPQIKVHTDISKVVVEFFYFLVQNRQTFLKYLSAI